MEGPKVEVHIVLPDDLQMPDCDDVFGVERADRLDIYCTLGHLREARATIVDYIVAFCRPDTMGRAA